LTLGRWVGLISLLISLYILWQVRSILLLFFMAIIFATWLNRIVRQFQKSQLKRGVAIGLTVAIAAPGQIPSSRSQYLLQSGR
jgi:predicted PurR-regulated permease PerM